MSSSWPYGDKSLQDLQTFCDIIKRDQQLLWLPELTFFKEFIESFGAVIPPKEMSSEKAASEPEACPKPEEPPSEEKMDDTVKEVSDEDREKAVEKRSEAVDQLNLGNIDKAIELYTEAIELDPTSALLYAKRGQAYLKQSNHEDCIKDCSRALQLNPNSAQAYKYRGRAFQLSEEWSKAWTDLRKAGDIDLDEEIQEWLKEVAPNVEKPKEEDPKATGEEPSDDATAHANAPKEFAEFFSDPEFKEAMSDPEIAAAIRDIGGNPANLQNYEKSPKVMAFIGLMSKKFLSSGISSETLANLYKFGGMFGPGPRAGSGEAPPPPKFQPPDDDNLD